MFEAATMILGSVTLPFFFSFFFSMTLHLTRRASPFQIFLYEIATRQGRARIPQTHCQLEFSEKKKKKANWIMSVNWAWGWEVKAPLKRMIDGSSRCRGVERKTKHISLDSIAPCLSFHTVRNISLTLSWCHPVGAKKSKTRICPQRVPDYTLIKPINDGSHELLCASDLFQFIRS